MWIINNIISSQMFMEKTCLWDIPIIFITWPWLLFCCEYMHGFYHLFISVLLLHLIWRSNYQEGKGCYLVNQFNPATFLCLSQARTWIAKVRCHGLFYVQWFEVRGCYSFCWYWWNCWPSPFKVCFVDIGGIVDHHRLKFFCWYWWNCWPSLTV